LLFLKRHVDPSGAHTVRCVDKQDTAQSNDVVIPWGGGGYVTNPRCVESLGERQPSNPTNKPDWTRLSTTMTNHPRTIRAGTPEEEIRCDGLEMRGRQ